MQPRARVVQASPRDPARAIEMAWLLGARAIAWDLREECDRAIEAARAARLRSEGWVAVARDPRAAANHPEWMHAPHRREWLQGLPGEYVVGDYIGLNHREAAAYAHEHLLATLADNPWCTRLWLSELQGPPMGCGCGSPCCRSWDNSPGPRVVDQSPRDLPDRFFAEEFFNRLMAATWEADRALQVCPILCPPCERDVRIGEAWDPDGPGGTNLCRGGDCGLIAHDYWPELRARFRAWRGSLFVPHVGLLLACDALAKNHPVYGEPRSWAKAAHQSYGEDLFPCIEPADADAFDRGLILLDAPPSARPIPAPLGYEVGLAGVNGR